MSIKGLETTPLCNCACTEQFRWWKVSQFSFGVVTFPLHNLPDNEKNKACLSVDTKVDVSYSDSPYVPVLFGHSLGLKYREKLLLPEENGFVFFTHPMYDEEKNSILTSG
ncbi:hypothetical protein AVEN_235738-1 [Araneus ventricosus]|uniref:Uncharacterized protein n=1 Tax=Araneus ventricosus TaxID=182803 RepID=A0A4Y2EUY3_ARAVE|nr:hypothetical protein AVEN_235738-1 [Araneus ventricosus]